MRVLHAHSGNLFGGVETFLLALISREASFSSEFALSFGGRLEKELSQLGAVVSRLPEVRLRSPWSVLRSRRAFRETLREHRPDAVMVHSGWAQLIYGPVTRELGIPLLRFVHAPPSSRHWLELTAVHVSPELLLCNSQYTAAAAARLYRASEIRTTYLPLRVAGAHGPDRQSLRASLDLSAEQLVILQVSRIERWKGHELHLRALSRLRHLEGWVALFVGGAQRRQERKLEARLHALTRELGLADRVRWLGERTDVRALMRASDIYCQPNIGPEPFGLTFVEALDAGLPVVATAMGGALEIVSPDCGLLVQPSADGVSAALEGLVVDSSRRRELSRAAAVRARELGDPAKRMRELRDVIVGALSSQNRSPVLDSMDGGR